MSDPSAASIVTPGPIEQPTGSPPDAGQPGAVRKEKPRGLLGDAWQDLRRKPLFWISAALIFKIGRASCRERV